MLTIRRIFPVLTVILSVGIAGCGGGGGTSSGSSVPGVGPAGSNVPMTQLQASLSASGVSNQWPAALLSGNAIPGQYGCSYNGDANCFIEFGNTKSGTGSNSGKLNLSSDAIPGLWQFAASSDSYCPSGASTGVVNVAAPQPVPIICNATGSGSAVASPSSCTDTYDQASDTTITNCPDTITFTVSGTTPLPTNPAVKVSYYTNTASLVSASNVTATSTTTITVPTPTTRGQIVVTLINPNTNKVVGAGVFGRGYKLIKAPPPCSPTTHNCTSIVRTNN